MLFNVSDCIYRFKIDTSDDSIEVVKNVFQVVAVKPKEESGLKYDKFKFKCFEDSKAVYREGRFCRIEDSDFNTIKPGNNCIYVTLMNDDEDHLRNILKEYFEERSNYFRTQAEKAEKAFKHFS